MTNVFRHRQTSYHIRRCGTTPNFLARPEERVELRDSTYQYFSDRFIQTESTTTLSSYSKL